MERVDEVALKSGRVVKPGDTVSLVAKPDSGREFMERFLDGQGPFVIFWIGRWPCGRHSLYFKTRTGEPGARADNFE